MRTQPWNDQRGFSLPELMLGIAVLAILMITALPNFAKMNADQKLKTAASDLESSMRRARSQAITRGIDVRVSVDPVNQTVIREADEDGDGNYETQISKLTMPEGTWLENVSFGSTEISFNSRGVPDNPGSVRIVGAHGYERTLTLMAGSGAITVSKATATQSQALQAN